jgi:glutamate-1-semialdehyde 2,1-aminomutase
VLATIAQKMNRSKEIFRRATKKIPGGVNSPVRAWKSVGGTPLVVDHGKGSLVFDADGRRYIDFVGSWGPLIFGHAHPKIVQVVKRRAARGFTFGAPTEPEVRLAEKVSQIMPTIKSLRLVNSGTEATMSAIRLARAFTGRRKILKFDGCYHGHSDGLLVKAGSGVATLGLPDSPGVPEGFARETLIANYNDIMSVQRLFDTHGEDIAAIIVEPVCGNMGVIPPQPDFLRGLRQITRQKGALLIFDEVITGFRVALGGAQSIFHIKPDLTCLGKILGGGFPLAAFGGARKIMNLLAPSGPVYQAGTLSGNPVAVSAGLATLKLLSRPGTYEELEEKGRRLEDEFRSILDQFGIISALNRVGSMMTLFFGIDRVNNADDARKCNRKQFARFFHGMLSRGIYLPPAPFEAMFISMAHSKADLDATIRAVKDWAAEGA